MHTSGVDITFLSGTRTVGGVQILVSTPAGAVLFDLGVVGNPDIVRDATLFNELLRPRAGQQLSDYLRAGMAPHIDGIYHPAAVPGGVAAVTAGIRNSPLHVGRPQIDLTDVERAVFISHLHDDHMQLIPFLAENTPLLMGERSARLHAGLVEAGTLPPTLATPTAVVAGASRAVGDLSLQVLPVDHDIPGSTGLLIDTTDGRIAYTGDWRLHGTRPELMHRFAEHCHGVDVLITEASTTGHSRGSVAAQVSESEIAPWVHDIIGATAGTLYLTLPERNLERHEQIRRAANDRGRRMLLSASTARRWQNSGPADVVAGNSAVWAAADGAPRPDGFPAVTAAQVAAEPEAWVAELPAPLWPLLLDTGAGSRDTFVHCNGHPYGPNDPQWPVLRTWVRELGLRWESISSHGHALPGHLAELVEAVSPGLVIPVHSNAPDAFPAVSAQVRTVTPGERVEVHRQQQTARSSR